jgi:hypothetical protein
VPAEEEPTGVREEAPSVSDSPPRMEVAEEHQAVNRVTSPAETLASPPSNRTAESATRTGIRHA